MNRKKIQGKEIDIGQHDTADVRKVMKRHVLQLDKKGEDLDELRTGLDLDMMDLLESRFLERTPGYFLNNRCLL
jgi:hypothetical protein